MYSISFILLWSFGFSKEILPHYFSLILSGYFSARSFTPVILCYSLFRQSRCVLESVSITLTDLVLSLSSTLRESVLLYFVTPIRFDPRRSDSQVNHRSQSSHNCITGADHSRKYANSIVDSLFCVRVLRIRSRLSWWDSIPSLCCSTGCPILWMLCD
jgi:hypothetical protein